MNRIVKTTGIAMAVAAAGMLTGCNSYETKTASAAPENVHCFGVNKCGGHNDCKTASNACKGQASCKGKGFVSTSAHACSEMGGRVG